jgi:hypothetical protein
VTSSAAPSSRDPAIEPRFARLADTATLSGSAFANWRKTRLVQVGAGHVGSRLAPEIVRSGASVSIYDPEPVSLENLGTQAFSCAGPNKADAVCQACEQIRPGAAESRPYDVRHAGGGERAAADGIIDCTDDARLGWMLTEISNGLAIPMFRLAVDGSGEHDLGRVQVSHGGGGAACRLCPKTPDQVLRLATRTPCPGAPSDDRGPTRAGAAVGLAVVGAALSLLQRYFGGYRRDEVLNTHVLVDLDAFRLVTMRELQSRTCVSGHVVWNLVRTDRDARQTTFGELFELAERELGCRVETLEPYRHSLCGSARCACGVEATAFGTRWATAPPCPACGSPTHWQTYTEKDRWSRAEARQAGVLDRTAAELGLPLRGAMLVARTGGKAPLRFVLR